MKFKNKVRKLLEKDDEMTIKYDSGKEKKEKLMTPKEREKDEMKKTSLDDKKKYKYNMDFPMSDWKKLSGNEKSIKREADKYADMMEIYYEEKGKKKPSRNKMTEAYKTAMQAGELEPQDKKVRSEVKKNISEAKKFLADKWKK